MSKYKLRAECEADALLAMRQLGPTFTGPCVVETAGSSKIGFDVTLTFESSLELFQIRQILAEIVNGHVITETVQLESEYTGNRN